MFNTEISQLVSTPSQIIAAAIREKLSAGGPWRIVLLPNSIAQFDYQLTIFISEFYISAVSKPYQAKVALQASVTTTAFDKLVYQRQFSAASDIEKAEIPSSFTTFAKQLINDCWNFEPNDRQSFKSIVDSLAKNHYDLVKLTENELIDVEKFVKQNKEKIEPYDF